MKPRAVLQRDVVDALRDEHAGVEFTRGVPTVSYKETVTAESPKPALSKSPNKHNRLYVIACPMEEECNLAIESGREFVDVSYSLIIFGN